MSALILCVKAVESETVGPGEGRAVAGHCHFLMKASLLTHLLTTPAGTPAPCFFFPPSLPSFLAVINIY